jgi:hypothetical protein
MTGPSIDKTAKADRKELQRSIIKTGGGQVLEPGARSSRYASATGKFTGKLPTQWREML